MKNMIYGNFADTCGGSRVPVVSALVIQRCFIDLPQLKKD
jgi:hypothetical protein